MILRNVLAKNLDLEKETNDAIVISGVQSLQLKDLLELVRGYTVLS